MKYCSVRGAEEVKTEEILEVNTEVVVKMQGPMQRRTVILM